MDIYIDIDGYRYGYIYRSIDIYLERERERERERELLEYQKMNQEEKLNKAETKPGISGSCL
jgi:hypothetical protein